MTSGSELTTVYNATTTQLNIINGSSWRKRFILICGLLLLFIGLVTTIVFSFSRYNHPPPENADGVTSSSTEGHVEDESKNWIVFIMGIILTSLGIIVLVVYFLFNRRLGSSSRGLIILPKPKQSRVLVVEQDKNTNTTCNEEKAELMRNELKNDCADKIEDPRIVLHP